MKFRKLRYNNQIFNDYVVSSIGEIYDVSYEPMRKVSINYPDHSNASSYARASLRGEDGKRITILVHIAVCDTWNRDSMPIPKGVTYSEWKRTPQSVKNWMRFTFQVNHIDHDKHNHHPKNLEYATVKENQNKYQEQRNLKLW